EPWPGKVNAGIREGATRGRPDSFHRRPNFASFAASFRFLNANSAPSRALTNAYRRRRRITATVGWPGARMLELAYSDGSNPSVLRGMWVRIPLRARTHPRHVEVGMQSSRSG